MYTLSRTAIKIHLQQSLIHSLLLISFLDLTRNHLPPVANWSGSRNAILSSWATQWQAHMGDKPDGPIEGNLVHADTPRLQSLGRALWGYPVTV